MSEKKDLKISIKRAQSLRELQEETSLGWERRMGQLYYQELEDGNFIPRVISANTNGHWVEQMISSGKIWLPADGCVCEMS